MEAVKEYGGPFLGPLIALWTETVATYSAQRIEFLGTFVIQILFFWLPSMLYLSLDVLAPRFSQHHKIQPAPKQPTRSDIVRCFKVVTQNQVLSSALHLGLIYLSKRLGSGTSYRVTSSLPTITEFIRDIAISLVLRETLFYYSHRLLHVPFLYRQIHKKHHKFTAPIALAAQFAHPVEQIFANALPISLPPQLLHSHILTFWVYLAWELFNTATVHSGYDFFHNKARMHDLHHEKFNLNYGSIGLFDWLHGTDTLDKTHRE
ncbi:Uncharacterized protein PECH_008202 [Penicillium ucsense]|uniref:Fatty acid hydroxylase domain-containing protein n=1 Tax=Penicillium ucsense TaxID=2839758 RepID=A0A8J8W2L3_9EURO|nr:Uncharacterized protein PECM_005027 [Penicillium ucsense]KAF7734407.1 Uncharacterized protein PECH_008202 [Penicillium ucsense]